MEVKVKLNKTIKSIDVSENVFFYPLLSGISSTEYASENLKYFEHSKPFGSIFCISLDLGTFILL